MIPPPVFALRTGEGDDPTTWLPRRLQAHPDSYSRRVRRILFIFIPYISNAPRPRLWRGPSQVVG